MERTFKGMLFATAAGAVMLTAASVEAAFVEASTALSDTVGTFDGNTQTGVTPSTGSDDTLLAFAPFDDKRDPVIFDRLLAPSPPNPAEVATAASTFLGFDVALVDFKNQSELGRIDVPDGSFDTLVGGCSTAGTGGCNFDIGEPFAYYAVKYSNAFALFADGGDNIAHYELGASNADTSNVTFLTPIPAAAWMMIGGLGMIGGAVARNRRKARADA